MTADQRLDQLEPLVAEAISVLDRHTAQLVRLNNNVNQLIEIATQQGDNIRFLLEENVKVSNRLTQLESDVAELKEGQARIENKLDLILSKLN